MGNIHQWFSQNIDYLFFIYGLSFLTMGIAILILPKKESRYQLAQILWLLAAYGFLHSVSDFTSIISEVKEETKNEVGLIFTSVSYLFLFEFGRRLMNLSKRAIPWWILPACTALTFLFVSLSSDFLTSVNIFVGYFIRFPAGMMAGIGLWQYYRFIKSDLNNKKTKTYFIIASVTMFAWAFLCGIVQVQGEFFPANFINTTSFFEFSGVPVQLFRTIASIFTTIALFGILDIFKWETVYQLQASKLELESKQQNLEKIIELRTAVLLKVNTELENDIKIRKKTEEALIKSEQRISTFIHDSLLNIYFFNPGTKKIIYANPAFLQTLGYAAEELGSLSIYDFVHHTKEEIESVFSRVMHTKQRSIGERQWKSKDGTLFNMLVNASYISHENEQIIFVSAQDITKRIKALDALSEANQFNQQIISSAQDGIIVYDRNLCYREWNPFMERFTGIKASQVLGKHPLEFFPFLEETGVLGNIKRALAGETVTTPDFSFTIPGSGASGWASDTNAPLKNSKGEIIGVIGTVRDITGRKTAEEALIKSNDLYRLLAENMSDMVALHNPQGEYVYVSPSSEKILGYKPDELIGISPYSIMHPDDQERIRKGIHQKSLSGEMNQTAEYRLRHKNGKYIWIESTATPLFDESKKNVIEIQSTSRVISVRKKTEESLKRNEEKLKQAQTIAHVGSWEVNLATRELSWSEEAYRIHGFQPGEIKPTFELWISLIHPDDLEYVKKEIEKSESSSSVSDFYHRIIRKDETVRYIYSALRYELNSNGKPIRLFGIAHDVTEQKSTEAKLTSTISEIDTFIYRASHDLKSPVSSLKGLLYLMKKEFRDKNFHDYLNMVEQTNTRMENIVDDLSSVVLIKDESRLPVLINIAGLIDSTIAMFEFLPGVDKVRFEVEAEKDFQLFSDSTLVSAILQNLIGNAIKYRLNGTNHFVAVKAEKKSKGVLITVSDNGEGISVKPIEKVFEMFYRGNLKSSGTGLGLYIVKKAIEKLGGSIHVKSEPRKGSTFTLFLPDAK